MRKGKPKARYVLPDPKFKDVLVTRFVNNLMERGKKNLAYKTFYNTLDLIEQRLSTDTEKVDGLEIWRKALNNVMPNVEVRSRRVGGANFQVPTEVRPERKISLSIKWIIRYARQRNEKTMIERLATELISASKNEGAAIKKREDTQRMAEANKAFSHFRF